MRRSVSIAVLSTALMFGAGTVAPSLVNVSASAQQKPETTEVKIDNFSFGPAAITVPIGTTVTWINHDNDVHTVTSSAQAFTSRGIDTDETFTYKFTKPGVYQYFCTLHPLMTGTVIVK